MIIARFKNSKVWHAFVDYYEQTGFHQFCVRWDKTGPIAGYPDRVETLKIKRIPKGHRFCQHCQRALDKGERPL